MANRYWVGGTGNWTETSHWSTSSGGSGGASVPVAADAVLIDSGSGSGTLTLNQNISVTSITGTNSGMTFAFATYTATLSGSYNCTSTITSMANGSIILTGEYSYFASAAGTAAGNITFNSTIATLTIPNVFGVTSIKNLTTSINGINLPNNITITGNLTVSSPGTSYYAIISTNTTLASSTINVGGDLLFNNAVFDRPFTLNVTGTSTYTGRWGMIGTSNGTTPSTRYWVGNSGNLNDTSHWSLTSGGAGGATLPLPQDNVVFDASSFSTTSTVASVSPLYMGPLTTATTDAPHTLQGFYHSSDITLSSFTTAAGQWYRKGINNVTFTTNGATTTGMSYWTHYQGTTFSLQQNTHLNSYSGNNSSVITNNYDFTTTNTMAIGAGSIAGSSTLSAGILSINGAFFQPDCIIKLTLAGGSFNLDAVNFVIKELHIMADNYSLEGNRTPNWTYSTRIGTLFLYRAGATGIDIQPTFAQPLYVDKIVGGGSQAAGNLTLASRTPGTRVRLHLKKECHVDYISFADIQIEGKTLYTGNYSSNSSNNFGKFVWGSATNLTYVTSTNSMSDLATYNFAGTLLGSASKNRFIIVAFATRKGGTSGTLVGVTIAGKPATILQTASTAADGNNQITGLAVVQDDTTTSGTVSVQFSEAFLRCNIQVLTANYLDLTKKTSGSGTGANSNVTLDVTYGGLTIGSAFNYDTTPTISWTDNDTPIRMRAVAQSTGWSEAGTHGTARAIPSGSTTSVQYRAFSANAVQMMAAVHLPYKRNNPDTNFFTFFYP